MLIGNLYCQPDSSYYFPEDFNNKFESIIEKVCNEDKKALLLGNFNCEYRSQATNRLLKQIISSYGFRQQVDSPMEVSDGSGSTIDLILTSRPFPETQAIAGATKNLRGFSHLITQLSFPMFELLTIKYQGVSK